MVLIDNTISKCVKKGGRERESEAVRTLEKGRKEVEYATD